MPLPLAIPLIGAGLAAAGIGAISESSNTDKTNASNERMQQKGFDYNNYSVDKAYFRQENMNKEQRDYETQMSNSAYQRRMADLKAAGLNPMLAINSGGADVPSVSAGSAPQASAPGYSPAQKSRVGEMIANMGSTAMDAARVGKEMESRDADIDLSRASAVAKGTEALVNLSSAKNLDATTDLTGERTKSEQIHQQGSGLENQVMLEHGEQARLKTTMMKMNMPAEEQDAILREKQARFDVGANKFDNITSRVGQMIGTIIGGVGVGAGLKKLLQSSGGSVLPQPQSAQPGTPAGDRYRKLLENQFERRTRQGGFNE